MGEETSRYPFLHVQGKASAAYDHETCPGGRVVRESTLTVENDSGESIDNPDDDSLPVLALSQLIADKTAPNRPADQPAIQEIRFS